MAASSAWVSVGLIGRFVLAAVLGLAAFGKVTDREAFRATVIEYDLVGTGRLAHIVAVVIVGVECALSLLLSVGYQLRFAAVAAGVLFLVFAAAVSVNLLRGRSIGCGCHGIRAGGDIGWPLVVVDLVFAGSAGVVAATEPNALSVDQLAGGPSALSTDEGFAGIVTALCALCIWWLGPQLLQRFRKEGTR